MEWFEVEAPPGKKIPKWMRSAGLSEDGVVFVPGAMAANEMEVILCAGYDCTPVVTYLKHAYFPSTWLAAEFPEAKELCQKIEANIRNANDKKNAV